MSSENHDFNLNSYIKIMELGEGSFGKVYKVRKQDTNEIYAIKISKNIITPGSQEMIMLSREVNINASVHHPSLLKFIDYNPVDYENNPKPIILTEYAENGSLSNLIDLERHSQSSFDFWDDTKKLIIIYGIASGMKYLHSHDILHRDLKPDNILMDDRLFPKIADFGLSKKIHSNANSMTQQSKSGLKGTMLYFPLESLETNKQTKAGDVYAFAMIVYELMTNQIPFENLTGFQIFKELINDHHPPLNFPIGEAYKNLIEKCWSRNPDDRPTFDKIVEELETNHDFITDSVIEDDFLDFVDFIKKNPDVYDEKQIIRNPGSKSFKKIDVRRYIEEQQNQSLFSSFFSRLFSQEKLYPADEFKKLDQNCQEMVVDAEKDPEKQFFIGKYLIEGINNFPLNVDLGVKYLERSISGKNIESTFYLSQMLYNGEIIEKDIKKAKKYLYKQIGSNDKRINILYSKICCKEKNYKEAIKYFDKYAKEGDPYSMYKYGKMLFLGLGCNININEAKHYFNLSLSKGFNKPKLYLLVIDKMNQNESFSNLSPDIQNCILKSVTNSNMKQFNLNNDLQSELIFKEIQFKFDDTQFLFTHKAFTSNDFVRTLQIFHNITIEILFPSKSFDSILNQISEIKINSIQQIKVCVFYSNTKSTELKIPNRKMINKIVIDSGIQKIGSYSFRDYISITQVTIPSSVTEIESGAFSGCSSLTQINIPSSVTSIGNYAFNRCSSLTQIIIPSSVTFIGESVFFECSSLTQIAISSSVTSINDFTFSRCSSLAQITIPSSVTKIGSCAFKECSSLTQITIPSSVTKIGSCAFKECSSLTQIIIPSSVTEIGYNGFSGCSSLTQIIIPSSVTEIGSCAFSYCKSLTQITIPSSFTKFGYGVLKHCDKLDKIIILSCLEKRFEYFDDRFLLYKSSVENESYDTILWVKQNIDSLTVPNFIKIIGNSAFSGCSSLTQITIHSSVTEIGDNCFEGCSSLTQITIPSSVTKIKWNTFKGCSSLVQITIPSSVTEIGECAFSECSSLAQITIPSSVTEIGEYAFSECSSLAQITIPSSVTSIGNYAFSECSSLTQITIPSSVTEIRKNTFYGCSSLKQISIPSSIKLTELYIPSNVIIKRIKK